jgi:hypothetical protein
VQQERVAVVEHDRRRLRRRAERGERVRGVDRARARALRHELHGLAEELREQRGRGVRRGLGRLAHACFDVARAEDGDVFQSKS